MEKVIRFQIAKVQPQGVAWLFFSTNSKNITKTWMEKVIRFQIAKVQPQGVP